MNKSIRKIESISKIMIVASVVAVIIGIWTIVTGAIGLWGSLKEGLSRGEYAEYVKMLAEGLVLVIHYFLVSKFLITALSKRVPLTHEVAKELRVLGWETLLLPLLVIVIDIVMHVGITPARDLIELEIYEIVLGVFIIQTGYVIDYATNKVVSGHKYHRICEELETKYPEIYKELSNCVITEEN